jgi:hypothetical protein
VAAGPSKPPIVGIAGFVKQLDHLARAHVLDLLDAEEDRLTPCPLNLLGQPLEELVVVGSVGKQVDRPLERDGADRAEPTPHAYPQARRIRREADYEEKKLGVHCVAIMKLLFQSVKTYCCEGQSRSTEACL